MNTKQIKYELQNLISGKSGASYDALIQAVASHLRSGKRASPMAEEKHQNKSQETEELIDFAKSTLLFRICNSTPTKSGFVIRPFVTSYKTPPPPAATAVPSIAAFSNHPAQVQAVSFRATLCRWQMTYPYPRKCRRSYLREAPFRGGLSGASSASR